MADKNKDLTPAQEADFYLKYGYVPGKGVKPDKPEPKEAMDYYLKRGSRDYNSEAAIARDDAYKYAGEAMGKHRQASQNAATPLNLGRDTAQERKRRANHEWYQHHKEWKKKYNKQYYQDNIEYWQKRYDMAMKRVNDSKRLQERDRSEGLSDNSQAALLRRQNIRTEVDEALRAKQNLDRANKEYSEYKDSKKIMPFTKAWKSGAEQIKNAGSAFLKKLLNK